jgi:hypothetical protein
MQLLTNLSKFGVNADVEMRKAAPTCSSINCTLISDLLHVIEEKPEVAFYWVLTPCSDAVDTNVSDNHAASSYTTQKSMI